MKSPGVGERRSLEKLKDMELTGRDNDDDAGDGGCDDDVYRFLIKMIRLIQRF